MRTITFTFMVPFGGRPAQICIGAIRRAITVHLLNSLSQIHPDIRCEIHESGGE